MLASSGPRTTCSTGVLTARWGFTWSASRTAPGDVTLSVVPPQEGTWEDPHGTPRYSLDIRRDGLTWSGGLQNATEHVLSIDHIDDSGRRIEGSFTGAWYPLTVQNLEFPMGSITGDFALAF